MTHFEKLAEVTLRFYKKLLDSEEILSQESYSAGRGFGSVFFQSAFKVRG